MKPITVEINKLVRKIFKKQHSLLPEIIINWGKIVGIKFNNKSTPLKITSIREDGKKVNILHITTEDYNISTEINYHKEVMIERIAIYLGYKGIHKINVSTRVQ